MSSSGPGDELWEWQRLFFTIRPKRSRLIDSQLLAEAKRSTAEREEPEECARSLQALGFASAGGGRRLGL